MTGSAFDFSDEGQQVAPEYHGSFSGVLKNTFDLRGTEEFKSKVVGLLGVSGGAMGGLSAVGPLRDVFRSLHAWVLPDQALVPQVWKEFNDDGSCKNEGIDRRLKELGKSTVKFSHLLTNNKAQEFLKMMETAVYQPCVRMIEIKNFINIRILV